LKSEIDELEHSAQVVGVSQVCFSSLVADELVGKTLINVCFLANIHVVRANELLDVFVYELIDEKYSKLTGRLCFCHKIVCCIRNSQSYPKYTAIQYTDRV